MSCFLVPDKRASVDHQNTLKIYKILFFMVVVLGVAGSASAFIASNQDGDLYWIDYSNGSASVIGYGFGTTGATEVEADSANGWVYMEGANGSYNLERIDPCAPEVLSTATSDAYGALSGLEFVGSTLYGTFIWPPMMMDSALVIVNPATGGVTPVGAGSVSEFPVSGLAYDTSSGIMYGVTAGGG